jgi:hypothetical protein
MRVQGGITAAAGPVGALPVPVPLRAETPFAEVLDGGARRVPDAEATRYGPLAVAQLQGNPIPAAPASAVPRVDAARAYARAPAGTGGLATGRAVSFSV